MPISSTLHLYARDGDIAQVSGTVGLLCELSPDSPCLKKADRCYGPEEILGSPDAALKVAHALVSKLLRQAPRVEDCPVLSVLEEPLLEEISYIAQALHLHDWISSHRFSRCHFVSYSPWLDRLRRLHPFRRADYELVADVPLFQRYPLSRALCRLWKSRPTPSMFARRVLPLWSRCASGVSRRKLAQAEPLGGIWFYSTAYNYTRIGLEYEPYLPEKLNFLVEDSTTGGKRLRETGRDWHLLYSWSRVTDTPSNSEVRSIGHRITAALAALPLSEEENVLRSVLLSSEWWRLFLTRRLPFTLFNGRALQRWLHAVRPEMIVVGNAGWERVLLMREDLKGVPLILLQHGIMHWVYAVTNEPVDVFVLRGPFFQRMLSDGLRHKTVVRNFPEQKPAVATTSPREDILFITTPYNVPAFYHDEDLRDILRSLLRVAHSSHRRLIVRVHPMEQISAYARMISELQPEMGLRVNVSYSQGPGAEEVLARSCVAVLHFSTMFLDCLRHGIPIVSFAWHWFPNRRQFEEAGIFNFASDLQHFEALLTQGIAGRLPRRGAGIEEFLAASRPEEIAAFFRRIWDSRGETSSRVLTPSGVNRTAASQPA